MTPIQAQTPQHQSAGADFNLKLAVSFFRHFGFLYNTYAARSGWSVSTVDKVANRAIRIGIQHLVRDDHLATLDRVTFLAAQNLHRALPGKFKTCLTEPPPWDGVDVSVHFYGKTSGDDVQVLQSLVQSMTGVPVNLDRTPPLLVNQPGAPTTTPHGDRGVSLVKEVDKLFQDKFIPPTVHIKDRGLVSMPPYSVPVPRAVNLARDVFNVSNKWMVRVNLPLLELRFCKNTHSIRLAVRQWTLERPWYANVNLIDCPDLERQMVWGYGWLTTWLIDMHAAKKAIPVDVHFADYIHRPHEHHAHSMAEIKPLYEKWRHDWVNYIDVIKASEENTMSNLPLPTTAPAPKTPVMPSTGIEVLDIFSLYIRASVHDESLSLQQAKQAALSRSKALLGLLKELGIHLSTTKANKELMENWRREMFTFLKDMAVYRAEGRESAEKPDDHP